MAAVIELLGQLIARAIAIFGTASTILAIVQDIKAAVGATPAGVSNADLEALLREIINILLQPMGGVVPRLGNIQTGTNTVIGNTHTNLGSTEPTSGLSYASLGAYAGLLAYNLGQLEVSFQLPIQPFIQVGQRWYEANTGGWAYLPTVDPATILVTDATVLDWLTREYTEAGISWGTAGSEIVQSADAYSTIGTVYTCTMTQDQFDAIKAALYPVGESAPVWPGIANVTLGAPTALVDGATIAGPLDGVLIAVSAVPPASQWRMYGANQSYRHIGSVAFLTDNGDLADFQNLVFGYQVISANQMSSAASAVVQCPSGVVGTIRSWAKA